MSNTEKTLSIIKPDAVERNLDGEIKKIFIDKGFKMIAIQQKGKGKADAVFQAFEKATNDVLIILDGDLTVPPEDIPKFWNKISNGDLIEYIQNNVSKVAFSQNREQDPGMSGDKDKILFSYK